MKRRCIKVAMLSMIALTVHECAAVSEFRTFLPMLWGPLSFDCAKREGEWGWQVWASAYTRTAREAYVKGSCDTKNLATLFFGQDPFAVYQVFPNSAVPTGSGLDPMSPLISVAILDPRVEYNEEGAMIGFSYTGRCRNGWEVGVRASIPFRVISVDRVLCDGLTNGTSPKIEDFIGYKTERIVEGQPAVRSYAFNLAFLSNLSVDQTNEQPLVVYSDSGIRIAGINVGQEVPPITVIERTDSTLPPKTPAYNWALTQTNAENSTENISLNGEGLTNDVHYRFRNDDYTALGNNTSAQSRLYVVPTVEDDTGGLTPGALAIENVVEHILATVDETAIDFFAQHGISFCSQRTVGLGDIYSEFFLAHTFPNAARLELQFLMGFPTGKQQNNPNEIFKMYTGSNGHLAIGGGIQASGAFKRWLYGRVKGTYFRYMAAQEMVAASFLGATVKNIGPAIPAHVAWGTFVGDFDLEFLHPHCDYIGLTAGYQIHVKQQDRIRFYQLTATDLAGQQNEPLDPAVLEAGTETIAHRIRTELFVRGDYHEFVFGANYTFAGRNCPRETDIYVGIGIVF